MGGRRREKKPLNHAKSIMGKVRGFDTCGFHKIALHCTCKTSGIFPKKYIQKKSLSFFICVFSLYAAWGLCLLGKRIPKKEEKKESR